ncbi:hypothetical protein Krac_0660 [Ktedonobacter racemifer DSM 44963]|uniref:Transposase n=1 Tax=Ktedonobacter racemifer DSM 44963 TaxID=485913 RepID=D6U896_KTERA|nr:hypothetical protein Krac_0660 [Ktedonobacter racemifer DSM 44963]
MLTRCHSPILPPWKEENFFDLALLAHTYQALVAPSGVSLGVDVGQRYLAVTATTTGQASFSGKQVRSTADHYARLRKALKYEWTGLQR